jgi:hypothetical protein
MLPALLLSLSLVQQVVPSGGGTPLAAPQRKVASPRLAIEPAGRVNLGSVGPTEVRQQRYLFKNTSGTPISLRVLDLSPGVTVEGPALQGPIAPQGSAQLTLRVDPSEFVGWQPRNVKLGTDDPGQGEYFLPVGMTVRPDLTIDALKKSFGEVAAHESPQVVYRFRRETGEATKLWVSSPLPPYLEAEIDPPPAQPRNAASGPAEERGSRGELRLTLRPAKVEPGMMAGLESITVESSAPHQPKFQLYLDWKLKLPVILSAPRLVFLNSGEWTRNLVLQGRDGKAVQVESARIEGEGFELSPPPAAPASRLELTVRRRAAAAAKAVLLLQLKGEPAPIRVPLSYLPPEEGRPLPSKPQPEIPAKTLPPKR